MGLCSVRNVVYIDLNGASALVWKWLYQLMLGLLWKCCIDLWGLYCGNVVSTYVSVWASACLVLGGFGKLRSLNVSFHRNLHLHVYDALNYIQAYFSIVIWLP